MTAGPRARGLQKPNGIQRWAPLAKRPGRGLTLFANNATGALDPAEEDVGVDVGLRARVALVRALGHRHVEEAHWPRERGACDRRRRRREWRPPLATQATPYYGHVATLRAARPYRHPCAAGYRSLRYRYGVPTRVQLVNCRDANFYAPPDNEARHRSIICYVRYPGIVYATRNTERFRTPPNDKLTRGPGSSTPVESGPRWRTTFVFAQLSPARRGARSKVVYLRRCVRAAPAAPPPALSARLDAFF
ncbi:unnamed protein product, partial [Iphiclides podalirius]